MNGREGHSVMATFLSAVLAIGGFGLFAASGCLVVRKQEKERASFLKKRSKKLLLVRPLSAGVRG
jgi:hypothetical protein